MQVLLARSRGILGDRFRGARHFPSRDTDSHERKPASVDEFVFATDSGRPRDKDSVRERSWCRWSIAPTRSEPSGGSRRCRKSRHMRCAAPTSA